MAATAACLTFDVDIEHLTEPAIVVKERVLVRRRRQVDGPGLESEGPAVFKEMDGVWAGCWHWDVEDAGGLTGEEREPNSCCS